MRKGELKVYARKISEAKVTIKTNYMNSYETVTEAVNDLDKRGYIDNLNKRKNSWSLRAEERNRLSAEDFDIDEVYRFEGISDPADEAILFAVSSKSFGVKGIVINAYGVYEDNQAFELIKALHHRIQ